MNKLTSLVVMPMRDTEEALLGYIAYIRFEDPKDDTDLSEWGRHALWFRVNRYMRSVANG